jgi:hypothetical protein
MSREQEIIGNVMRRAVKIGAQNTFLCVDGDIIPLADALAGYIDEFNIALDDIRFHYVPLDQVVTAEDDTPYMSINPLEMSIMTTTKFPTDDLGVMRTINFRAMFKNEKGMIRIGSFLETIINALGELDAL